MKRYAPLLCVAMAFAFTLPPPARAQTGDGVPADAAVQGAGYETPAHIALVEGSAVLERDGRTDSAPSSMPLLAGDRVRTQVGRVEVLFADGSTLHLDHSTTVDFQSDEVVRLLSGRIRLNIPVTARNVAYRVDAPGAWVQIDYPGEYRIALLTDDEIELAVLRGAAELVNEDGRQPLRAGERAFARAGAAPSRPYVFNSAAWDSFDRWSESRRGERLGVSTQYLPDQVRPYASTFDRYGTWRHEPQYGYVWYPTVHVGWRPYYRGRWAPLRPYGWTWIGLDPWGWPTHHYGRWGFSAGVWFWIPGRHWGPAWVSWAYAPGYVSWCPLGWNNRPVIQFVNVNVHRGYRGRRYYDHWNAWTVVPRRHFGSTFVNVNVVRGSTIATRGRSAFVVRNRGPEITGYAVPRSAAPIRAAGTRVGTAVPRGTAPAGSTDISTARSQSLSPSGERRSAPLRSRPGTTTTGPGLPAASRAPRASPESSAAPEARGAASARGVQSNVRGRTVMPRRESAPYDPGPSRRAVPRESRSREAAPAPVTNPDRGPAYTVPSRTRSRAEERQYGPSPAARPEHSRPEYPRAEYPRPAPRTGSSDAYAPRRDREAYPPPAIYRGPERTEPSGGYPSAPRQERPRATPRGGSSPPAYSPSPERAAPRSYGPPAAPRVERSAPPPAQAPRPQPEARPRGGERSGGAAVRRPRGN